DTTDQCRRRPAKAAVVSEDGHAEGFRRAELVLGGQELDGTVVASQLVPCGVAFQLETCVLHPPGDLGRGDVCFRLVRTSSKNTKEGARSPVAEPCLNSVGPELRGIEAAEDGGKLIEVSEGNGHEGRAPVGRSDDACRCPHGGGGNGSGEIDLTLVKIRAPEGLLLRHLPHSSALRMRSRL